MNRQHVRAGVDKSRNVLVGIRNHQMDVQRQFGHFPYGFHYWWPDSDVRHKMAVHHIHMQQMCPGFFDLADVFAERRKVRRKNGRSDTDVHWLTSSRMISVFDKR